VHCVCRDADWKPAGTVVFTLSPSQQKYVVKMKPDGVVFLGDTFPDDAAVPLMFVEYKAKGGDDAVDGYCLYTRQARTCRCPVQQRF
jgi:hypothetical protein